MTGIDSWSGTPATNSTADGGAINWAEGQAPSTVNNTARQMCADVRSRNNDLIWFQYGTGDQGSGNLAVPGVYSSATAFTITGADVTTIYNAGRRVRAVGTSTGTIYGTISSSTYNGGSTTTTVNMTWDSGSLSNETLVISLSQIPVTGDPMPAGAFSGVLPVANGGTNASSASITAFNNITGYTAAGATGTTSTNIVFSTSPTLVTPTLGAATATSINGLTITSSASGVLTITAGKTFTTLKTISLTAADDTGVYTFPTGTKTLAATDVTTLSSLASIGTITTGVWNAGAVTSSGAIRGTLIGAGMAPTNLFDGTLSVNGSALGKILNSNAGTSTQTGWELDNGTSVAGIFHTGTSYTTNLPYRQNGTYVYGAGAGGLSLVTGANQPIYFAVNATAVGNWSGSLLTSSTPISVSDATQSTSTTTGALITAGGLGIVKDAFIGGAINGATTIKAGTGIAVGGATPGTGGVAFPATAVAVADANTLDDYEEGTFTPLFIINNNSSPTGLTYGTQTGTYTKVGRQVTCIVALVLTAKGSTPGNVQVGGFPFSSIGRATPQLISSTAAVNGCKPLFQGSNGVVDLWTTIDSTWIADTDLTNTTSVYITVTYTN